MRATLARVMTQAANWLAPKNSATAASAYEAGAQTRRTLKWNAPTSSPNQALLANLTTLRDRSRASVRNDGHAKSIIDALVSNLIGTGIQPLSKAQDSEFRRRVQDLWLAWTDESDADGLLDFYGQQAQAARAWLEGGECFARLRPRLPEDDLTVPFQVQILEPELCPHTYNALLPKTGNRVRAGIEFNRIGRRVAYWFHPSRPGELDDYDRAQLRRIPADSVIHLFDPLRPGQLRGLPQLTQALIRLHELDKFDDATLLRQQLANLFAGFLKRPATTGDDAVDPLTGLALSSTTDAEAPVLSLEPGILQELAPGEEVEFSDPPAVSDSYEAFMRRQLTAACTAAGTSYEIVTGDMRGLNDRTMRVLLNEFRRRIQAWQHQRMAFQFCRPIWRAWLDRVFLSGALPIPIAYLENTSPWAAVKWMPPKWAYIHPVQDVQAQKEAIRNGFTSRSAVVSENGEDADAIDAEQQADNERADALGLRYDSDGRRANNTTARVEADPTSEPAT